MLICCVNDVNLSAQYFYMKKFYIAAFFVTISQLAVAQTLSPEDAAKRVGDSITVCGQIYGGRYFETSKGSPTLLNMGAAFPASPITIMIPGDVRSKLGFIPEAELKDKNICVRGRVILFKDRPEIIIYSASQLEVQK
jgi:hypothetical protein